ncbi:MAG: hypothetical protein U1F22_10825 [Lysobacterales bacterium]
MRRVVVSMFALLCALSAASLPAAKYDARRVVTAQTKTEFVEQAREVREGMQPNGRYEFVTPDERERVEKRLTEMQAVFDNYVEGKRLPDTTLVQLLTAQEEVNGILTRRDGERLICKNEMPTGSHRPVNNCKRYADIERARRETQKTLYSLGATPCNVQSCRGG